MTDLDKALAAAREALQNPDLPGDPVSVAMCDLLLAALDAAREQAVAWQVTVVDNTGTHDYAKWAGLQAPPAAAVSAEEAIEAAYWDFDARHKGYGPHKTTPQSERDAFKWAVRALLAAAERKGGES